MVAHLPPSQLSHPHHAQAALREACARSCVLLGQGEAALEASLREVGELLADAEQGDGAGDVVDGDPQDLGVLEPAQLPEPVLEVCIERTRVGAGSRGGEPSRSSISPRKSFKLFFRARRSSRRRASSSSG